MYHILVVGRDIFDCTCIWLQRNQGGRVRRRVKPRRTKTTTEGLWHQEYMAFPKSMETLTMVPKRPVFEGNALVKYDPGTLRDLRP